MWLVYPYIATVFYIPGIQDSISKLRARNPFLCPSIHSSSSSVYTWYLVPGSVKLRVARY